MVAAGAVVALLVVSLGWVDDAARREGNSAAEDDLRGMLAANGAAPSLRDVGESDDGGIPVTVVPTEIVDAPDGFMDRLMESASASTMEGASAEERLESAGIHGLEVAEETVAHDLPGTAGELLEGFEAEGRDLVYSGYLDLLGDVWGCVVREGTKAEVVVVRETAQEDEPTSLVQRITPVLNVGAPDGST